MSTLQNRKNKVVLSDYNYHRDIQHRLLIATAASIEIDIINEIINSSLRIPIAQLAETVDISQDQLTEVLKKLIENNFIKIQNSTIVVDKETRKYYEGQMAKFDPDFVPGIDFLHYLLQQVPIHVLPSWYAIPRTTDNIFQAIVEKFLATPRIYERYLEELHFDNLTVEYIYKDVFSAPDFMVPAKDIMKKYQLSHKEFEENILLLEYHFVCCLSYQKLEDRWEEVVTPFYEWREYARFKRDTLPKSLSDSSAIGRRHPSDFGFIEDLTTILRAALKTPFTIEIRKGSPSFIMSELTPLLKGDTTPDYASKILEKALDMKLAFIENSKWIASPSAKQWYEKSSSEKSASFSHYLSIVGKSLCRIINSDWVYLDDFMKGFVSSNMGKELIVLKQKGKRWKYERPHYSQEELDAFKEILYERLFEAGIVAVGTYRKKKCLTLTPYGRMILS
jgi:DNA-binding Lrp family transcriptional regulator